MKKIIAIATILILINSCKKTEQLPIKINYDYVLIEVITESKKDLIIKTNKKDTKYYSDINGYASALVKIAPLDSFKWSIIGTDYSFSFTKNDTIQGLKGKAIGQYTFEDWFYNN
jgi:hypothetical protein